MQITNRKKIAQKIIANRRVKLKLYSICLPYFTVTVNWPGMLTSMTPPHVHINFEESFNVGILPNNWVGDPGIQGARVMGMQGIGVRAPMAAAVAAITMGFAID